jgi:hypothetical protein
LVPEALKPTNIGSLGSKHEIENQKGTSAWLAILDCRLESTQTTTQGCLPVPRGVFDQLLTT